MFLMFPLLAIMLIVYNLIVLGKVIQSGGDLNVLDIGLLDIPMVSGEVWSLTVADLFLLFSLGFLFIELLRSTQTGSGSIINHAFSMVVFIVCLLEFVLVPGFGNSTFFLFMMMTLMDVMAGFIVTVVSARRDFGVAEGAFGNGGGGG